ncbi:Mannose-6-phosphate isomerase [Candidatus Protofrankia californiensis]|uniref:mannose-6-phosphate isomerase n=1 Tax=Candidatus Protofrankia californiensis TaxID=1839754 RepID=A0A1C3NW33_9ACTN|nr:Mannose-6-phosphate isomerase [Candidatus Protofrankia californiensis]
MTGGQSAGILRLFGRVRDYDWGSPTAIYDLLGEDPSGRPAAELWLGTHPSAPSEIETETGGRRRPAEAAVGRLPFLLKVLAADKALSLQVHPDRAQAQAGFDGEERAGVPPQAPHRRYRDRNHKPELIVALTPFRALAGIRDPQRTLCVVQSLGHPPLTAAFEPLWEDPSAGAATVLRTLLTMPAHQVRGLVDGIVKAAGMIGPRAEPDVAAAADLVGQLAVAHPGDVGIAAALLLNDVLLQPGEALFQPARLLHAYVHGVGIEIMATSDNVLRGGLTSKHVDVDELLRVLDPTPTRAPVLAPRTVRGAAGITVRTWDVPVDDFVLAEAVCDETMPNRADPRGNVHDGSVTVRRPAVLLVTDGTVMVEGMGVCATRLRRGQAAVVAPAPGAQGVSEAEGVLTLRGRGRVFLASPGSCAPS